MILEITKVKYLRGYSLWLQFNDGTEGAVDLADELTGPVFGPLADKKLFKAVRVDPLLRTIAWPNEADLAPEFLYERLTPSRSASGLTQSSQKALQVLRTAVRDGVAEHRRAGVPIVVRTEKPAGRRQPALVREDKATYRTPKSRKVDR